MWAPLVPPHGRTAAAELRVRDTRVAGHQTFNPPATEYFWNRTAARHSPRNSIPLRRQNYWPLLLRNKTISHYEPSNIRLSNRAACLRLLPCILYFVSFLLDVFVRVTNEQSRTAVLLIYCFYYREISILSADNDANSYCTHIVREERLIENHPWSVVYETKIEKPTFRLVLMDPAGTFVWR